MISRTVQGVVSFAITAVLTGAVWLGVAISDRGFPVSTVSYSVKPNPVEPGGLLQLDVAVLYLRPCRVTVRRTLYDSKGIPFVAQELRIPPGQPGFQHSASDIPIPVTFALGKARYVASPSYACNWFQRLIWPITVPDRMVEFSVTAPKGSTP